MTRLIDLLRRVIFLLALGAMQLAPAQVIGLERYGYRSWSVEQGLPQLTVEALQKDAAGALWIGTQGGLVRFYGSDMEVFRSAQAPALGSNWIRKLLRAGPLMYIATQKNLVWWDGSALHAVPDSEQLGVIRELAVDDAGQLWILADRLARWDGKHLRSFDALPHDFSALALQGRIPFLIDGQGAMWSLRNGQLQRAGMAWPDPGNRISSLLWHESVWWLGSARGLYRWSEGGNGAPQFVAGATPGPTPVTTLTLDQPGHLWVLAGGAVTVLQHGAVLARLPPDDRTAAKSRRSLMAENLGSFWVGGLSDGLSHYWQSPTMQLQPEANGRPLHVWSYARTSQGLLAGTDQGVWRIDGERMQPLLDQPALEHRSVQALLEDRDGHLWLGTGSGVLVWRQGQLQPVAALDGVVVHSLTLQADGQVLAGTAQGLYQIDRATRQALRLFREQLPGGVTTFAPASGQTLWVGSDRGLWHLDGAMLTPRAQTALGGAMVTAITTLKSGALLVGTYQRGVHELAGDAHRQWTQGSGLPADGVFSLNEANGWVWATFADGVYRFQLRPGAERALGAMQLVHIDPGAGDSHSRIRCCNGLGRDKGVLDGKYLWAASLAGAVRTTIAAPEPQALRMVLRKVVNGGQALQPRDRKLALGPDQRDLEISFEAHEYRVPQLLQYRYRMPPFQPDWRLTDKRHIAYFTNLPPQALRFEAQASWDGVHWSEAAVLDLTIRPRFTEEPLFLLLMLLVAGGSVYGLFQLRLRRLKGQSRRLQQEVERQTEALRQANDGLAALNQSLEQASLTDPLTGLRNRRYVQQQVPALLAGLRRRRAQPGATAVLGVLLIDLDHFKQINDRFGHDVGDAVLVGVATALRTVLRGEDHAVRWGGEEFLLLVQANGAQELQQMARRLHAALAVHAAGTAAGPVTASLGMVSLPLAGGQLDDDAIASAIQLADFALYAVKEAGRNASGSVDLDASVVLAGHGSGAEQFKAWAAAGWLRVELLPNLP